VLNILAKCDAVYIFLNENIKANEIIWLGINMLAEQIMSDGFQGLKVMVIDDSKTIRRTAETLLKKAGCEVFTATDGFEALSKIADHKPGCRGLMAIKRQH